MASVIVNPIIIMMLGSLKEMVTLPIIGRRTGPFKQFDIAESLQVDPLFDCPIHLSSFNDRATCKGLLTVLTPQIHSWWHGASEFQSPMSSSSSSSEDWAGGTSKREEDLVHLISWLLKLLPGSVLLIWPPQVSSCRIVDWVANGNDRIHRHIRIIRFSQ
jgi:hypothetical protein